MTVQHPLHHVGLVFVRASTDPGDLDVPAGVDLDLPEAVRRDGMAFLMRMWTRPTVRAAILLANPGLADRLDHLLAAGAVTDIKTLRRALLSVASYLLRWQGRATPFGLFAGVTTATIGPSTFTADDTARTVARADAEWILAVAKQLEHDPDLWTRLTVVADNTTVMRDGRFFVARRATHDDARAVPLREASLRATPPVQHALALAAAPIRLADLAASIANHFPAAAAEQVNAVLATLVEGGFLISSLRPPMTITDELSYLIETVIAAGGRQRPEVADLLGEMERAKHILLRHNTTADPSVTADLRADAASRLALLTGNRSTTLTVDTRVGLKVQIPETVLTEAALAANTLLRVATKPFGTTAWQDYRIRFRSRYGVGALVPVRDLLADSGLGYPTGFLGAPRAHPSWRNLTDRDAAILALVQRAAMDGQDEIVLTDADLTALTVGNPGDVAPPPRVEIGVTILADSAAAVDRGNFLLHVVATPAAATSMAGRFAYLLDPDDRERLAATFRGRRDDFLPAQLSYPPRRPHNENVTRVPLMVPDVIALGEHPTGNAISVENLAVTTDGSHLFLVQLSTGRPVAPFIPHALDTVVQSPPLARFLAEVSDARTAVFGPVDMGAARVMPYLPRLRYQRIILAAARWLLNSTIVPPGRDWNIAFDRWRRAWRVPNRVVLCHGELRLPIDLDRRVDRAILRSRLAHGERLELHENLRAGCDGWPGRPVELVVPLVAAEPSVRPLPPLATPARRIQPGSGPTVKALLAGNPARFDEVLTRHLPAFMDSLDRSVHRWWISRHRDLVRLEADQHLILVLRLTDPADHQTVVGRLAAFADGLHTSGLPAELTLTANQPHPGRFGDGDALAAAEDVFAADTRCAITQLVIADQTGVPAQALAAASMVRIAAALDSSDATIGYRALLALPHEPGAVDQTLRKDVLRLTDPTGMTDAAHQPLSAAWDARHQALDRYFQLLAKQRDIATVLPTLLQQHHARALGIDPDFAKTTNRLARTAALRFLAPTDAR